MTVKNVFVTGIIAGAAVGAVAGLLLAPKPGKVTRRFAVSRASRIGQQAGGYLSRYMGRGKVVSPAKNGG